MNKEEAKREIKQIIDDSIWSTEANGVEVTGCMDVDELTVEIFSVIEAIDKL